MARSIPGTKGMVIFMKKMFALFLCIMLVLAVFSGCGKKDANKSSETSSVSEDSDVSDGEGEEQIGDDGEVLVPDGTSTEGTASGGTSKGSAASSKGGGTSSKSGGSTASGGAGGSAPANTSKTLNLPKTTQEKAFESAKGSSILMFYDGNISDNDKKIADEFKERYGISIKYEVMGWAEYNSKIAQRVASGNPPDTAVMTDATALRFMYGGIAQPLNKYINTADKIWDFEAVKDYSIGKNIYGLPIKDINTFFIYYNKTMFDELGKKEPYKYYTEGTWTFDTFRKVAKEMTQYAADKTTVTCYGFASWYKELFVLAAGGNIISQTADGRYASSIGTPNAIAGLNMIKNLSLDGSYDPNVTGYKEFKNRQVAMIGERPFNAIGQYDYYNTMKDKIGIVPVPKESASAKLYAPNNLSTYYVPVNAKNPSGGVAWAYFNLYRALEGEKQNYEPVVSYRKKSISDEHKSIIDTYLSKSTPLASKLDSLNGWGGDNSNEFWSGLIEQHKNAEEVIGSMKTMLDTAIVRTIGK